MIEHQIDFWNCRFESGYPAKFIIMSDRLALYNPRTEQYIIFAKDFGSGFSLGNVEKLSQFLRESFIEDGIICKDWNELPENAESINHSGNWLTYESQ